MELLKEIAAVSGKGGLFRILKPTRNGVILETIDEKKTKLVANANDRVSILKEISIYTTDADAAKPLEEVLISVYQKYNDKLEVTPKSSEAELRNFMASVLPEYDEDRVYASDIKKLVSWYGLLISNFPEIFDTPNEDEKEIKKTVKSSKKKDDTAVEEEKPKKKAAPKAKKETADKESTADKPKATKTRATKKKEDK